jgi:hypothetical protein
MGFGSLEDGNPIMVVHPAPAGEEFHLGLHRLLAAWLFLLSLHLALYIPMLPLRCW